MSRLAWTAVPIALVFAGGWLAPAGWPAIALVAAGTVAAVAVSALLYRGPSVRQRRAQYDAEAARISDPDDWGFDR